MEWIQRRAGLIGIGAVVVALVAIGVAIAGGHSSRHREIGWFGPAPFAGKVAPGPFARQFGGPMERGFGVGPQLTGPGGGMLLRRFGGGPTTVGPLMGRALHGEFTVPGANGKYQTVDVQRGTVSKVGSGQLTVHSSDGFSKTYAVSSALAKGVAKGDGVEVEATVSGSKATVVRLVELNSVSSGTAPMPYGMG